MRFNVSIDDNDYRCAYIGKTARLFREQFRKDLQLTVGEKMGDYVKLLTETKDEVTDDPIALLGILVKAISPEFAEKILWACLYAENPETGLYEEWLDGVENYPDVLAAGALAFQVVAGAFTTVESSEATSEDSKKK